MVLTKMTSNNFVILALCIFVSYASVSKASDNVYLCSKDKGLRQQLENNLDLFDELDPEYVDKNDIEFRLYALEKTNIFLAIFQLDGFSNSFVVDMNKGNAKEKCFISKKIDLGSVKFLSSEAVNNTVFILLENYPKGTNVQSKKVHIQYSKGKVEVH